MEGKTVLVVDDEEGIRRNLMDLLSMHGCTGVEAASVAAAKEILGSTKVDLVVTDWALGPMAQEESGIGLIKWMRNHKEYSHIPTVLMSGDLTEWAINESKATAIYRKEDTVDNFFKSIDTALESAGRGSGRAEPNL